MITLPEDVYQALKTIKSDPNLLVVPATGLILVDALTAMRHLPGAVVAFDGGVVRTVDSELLTAEQCYFFGRQGVRGRQKINCFGLWRSKTILFGGGWRPEGRQVINSTGKLWHSRAPTNEFGCHGLAGDILRIFSSNDVSTVYRHIQHCAAPRPAGCKGGAGDE
jgi:hypothetical protein